MNAGPSFKGVSVDPDPERCRLCGRAFCFLNGNGQARACANEEDCLKARVRARRGAGARMDKSRG